MIPCFIGWDSVETVAWHTLCDSIIQHTTEPVAFTAIGNDVLPKSVWWRERGPHDSTAFSNARFAVPALVDYKGWALYMDGDMVALADIAKLWAQRSDEYAVMVVKHHHVPREAVKFTGYAQTKYAFKNWSSLMLFNCDHPHTKFLTTAYINTVPGLDLHRFAWTMPDQIGAIKGQWNVLATREGLEHPSLTTEPCLIHYTSGGPWHGYSPSLAHYWDQALLNMLGRDNPCATINHSSWSVQFTERDVARK